ncbi:hypothetical protein HYH03_001333 [Edaphochlamys debaryana]|uniref:Uncharacterized protein n=1 Tax=Edaphochlamys debaryana TaxID=47281 RepID=A0A836C6C1_9CHLO|nr:hypothetical protein HYH03_001333 [Edaphochlamys debaryana]|eukprot:KAG2500562.1 hypothetical protein HYH03_001333 [Edaphochlamys debaryana]
MGPPPASAAPASSAAAPAAAPDVAKSAPPAPAAPASPASVTGPLPPSPESPSPLLRMLLREGQPELVAALGGGGGGGGGGEGEGESEGKPGGGAEGGAGAGAGFFPGFSQLVELQAEVLQRLEGALGVAPAQTKHTDEHGIMRLQSLRPGAAVNLFRSYRVPSPAASGAGASTPAARVTPIRTMTQLFSRYVTPDGVARIYTKTTTSTPDHWPTPQLDVEIGGTEQQLIFYVGLGPKAPISSDLPYLDLYYNRPPPPPPSPASPSSSPSDAAPPAAPPLPSFKAVEAEARAQPGFTPFVSPSLWVRALAAGALCFTVAWDGGRDAAAMERVRRYALAVAEIWLAFVAADAAGAGGGAADADVSTVGAAATTGGDGSVSDGGAASGGGGGGQAAAGGWALAARDGAAGGGGGGDAFVREQWRRGGVSLRNHVRHDPMTPLLYPVFGEDGVTQWIEMVAGDE